MVVGDHLDLLSNQFLAKASVGSHPSNPIITRPSGPRSLRHTLSSKHGAAVAPFASAGVIQREDIGSVIEDLHTISVRASITALDAQPNRVLGARPPKVDGSEKLLPQP